MDAAAVGAAAANWDVGGGVANGVGTVLGLALGLALGPIVVGAAVTNCGGVTASTERLSGNTTASTVACARICATRPRAPAPPVSASAATASSRTLLTTEAAVNPAAVPPCMPSKWLCAMSCHGIAEH